MKGLVMLILILPSLLNAQSLNFLTPVSMQRLVDALNVLEKPMLLDSAIRISIQ